MTEMSEGVGVSSAVGSWLEIAGESEFVLSILEDTVVRAPTSLTVVVAGGISRGSVTFSIDGTDVYTAGLDSEGYLGPTSINLNTTLGTLGAHTLTATLSPGTLTATASFTVLRAPSPSPGVAGVDAPAVEVPGALVTEGGHAMRHWVLQDLLAEEDGGIGSYVFPHNPRTMASPHLEHAITAKRTTASDGVNHLYSAGQLPKEWTFGGYCPSQAHQAAIEAYRDLNRRFWVIDHHNRAWKVIWTDAQFVPRLRQSYNGVLTDWGSDFTCTVTILEQGWQQL